MRTRALAALGWASIAAGALAGCRGDQFVCGEGAGTGVARVCDRSGEVCICATNQCARFEPSCPTSYEYVFTDGDQECVGSQELLTALDQNLAEGEGTYCPGQVARPPACGVLKDGKALACAASEVCLCGEKQCAHAQSSCASGWEWSFAGTCVPAPVDLATEVPDRFSGLCRDQLPPTGLYPDDCGKARPDGSAILCGANQACVCKTTSCAAPDPSCSAAGEVGLRYVASEQCVTDITNVASDYPDPENGFCPGWHLGGVVP
jgi:hypothetical protein